MATDHAGQGAQRSRRRRLVAGACVVFALLGAWAAYNWLSFRVFGVTTRLLEAVCAAGFVRRVDLRDGAPLVVESVDWLGGELRVNPVELGRRDERLAVTVRDADMTIGFSGWDAIVHQRVAVDEIRLAGGVLQVVEHAPGRRVDPLDTTGMCAGAGPVPPLVWDDATLELALDAGGGARVEVAGSIATLRTPGGAGWDEALARSMVRASFDGGGTGVEAEHDPGGVLRVRALPVSWLSRLQTAPTEPRLVDGTIDLTLESRSSEALAWGLSLREPRVESARDPVGLLADLVRDKARRHTPLRYELWLADDVARGLGPVRFLAWLLASSAVAAVRYEPGEALETDASGIPRERVHGSSRASSDPLWVQGALSAGCWPDVVRDGAPLGYEREASRGVARWLRLECGGGGGGGVVVVRFPTAADAARAHGASDLLTEPCAGTDAPCLLGVSHVGETLDQVDLSLQVCRTWVAVWLAGSRDASAVERYARALRARLEPEACRE